MRYKAILTDIDGTLIPNKKDGKVSSKVIASIMQAHKKIKFGVATSRSANNVIEQFGYLPLGPSIVYGGAKIIDPSHKTVLWEKLLTLEDAHFVYQQAKKFNITFFANDNDKEINIEYGYAPQKPISYWGHGLDQPSLETFKQAVSHLPDIAIHTIPSWKKDKIDFIVTHAQATKQYAILELAKILNIQTDEIIGIGDGANDLPLLMACGLKIAVGNAVDSLKEIADYVSPSVEEDALADVIEKFVE